MSIFGKIMGAIFGGSAQAQGGATGSGNAPGSTPGGSTSSAGMGTGTSASMTNVDVGATLDNLAKQKKEKLDWKHSIVDLMKLLDLDSSQSARKELAKELNYTGDTSDSAKMNVWLHKQVMAKLAANGGKVPADLRD